MSGVGDIPGIEADVWVEGADLDRAETILHRHQDRRPGGASAKEASGTSSNGKLITNRKLLSQLPKEVGTCQRRPHLGPDDCIRRWS